MIARTTLRFTNSTITDNSANTGGGIYAYSMAAQFECITTVDIANTIVWGNTASGSGSDMYVYEEDGIFWDNDAITTVNASYSDIGDVALDPTYPGTYNDLGNNTDADPLFVDSSNSNYRLAAGSQCVDAGDNTDPNISFTDIVGNERVIDGDSDCMAVVDMGAYEMSLGRDCIFVDTDIRPGSYPNDIDLNSKGIVSVAILTTEDFDATTVNALSVEFGPYGAAESHGKSHIEDVDEDGDLDLVLHFRTQEAGITCGDLEVGLTGETFGGHTIKGIDSINIEGCN